MNIPLLNQKVEKTSIARRCRGIFYPSSALSVTGAYLRGHEMEVFGELSALPQI